MGLLQGFKNLFGRKREERADYDAASDSRHIVGTYRTATDRNQNRILEEERGTMRTRLNSEFRNNIYLRRVSKLYANFAVGTGPSLQIKTQNKEWGRKVEKLFKAWALRCDARGARQGGLSLARMLHIGTRRLFADGEFMLVMETARAAPENEVALRIRAVRANRRMTPLEEALNPVFVDGIELDNEGEPKTYWFLKKDPGDRTQFSSLGFSKNDFDQVPAERVIHIFTPDEYEQDTGEPWGAPTLSTIAGDRRFRHATLLAAETAAKYAVFFEVDKPELLIDDDGVSQFKVQGRNGIELNAGTAGFLPPGYKVAQVSPEHPATTYPEFKRENLAELGLAGDMPVNLVTGDSSKHNFASAQFDGWSVEIEISCFRQYGLEESGIDRVFLEWLREAVLVGEVTAVPDDFDFDWGWPVNRYWRNPLHQASADEKDMSSRKKTLFDVWEENGVDADAMIAKLKRQDELLSQLKYKPSFLAEKQVAPANGGEESKQAGADEKNGK